ncbi:MAG: ABC transporter substrate-binding protein [Alphaproteobacteria bacterium]
MGAFSHLSRRRFMKGTALAAGSAAFAPGFLRSRYARAEKRFDIDIPVSWDSNWQNAALWLSPLIKEEAGVGISSHEIYDSGETTAKLFPQLLSKNPRFSWAVYPSLYFGVFAESGVLEPLDDYLAQYEGAAEYDEWVMPRYGEFYTKWGGKTYGFMVDGDIHNLHYRPSYFNNSEYQKKYSQRFQRELAVPKTWEEFRDVARFFTDELSSTGIYGTSVVMAPPNFSWGFWFDVAASYGVKYFDENMNPGINTPAAAESLELFKEIVLTGPPGKESLDIGGTIARWESGADVMSIWWIDLAEFTVRSQGLERAQDQGSEVVPGTVQADGTILNTPVALFSRTVSVPANASEEQKEAAAYFIYRMSHKDYSEHYCADPYCGSDPFGKTHFGDAAAKMYTEPNPQRTTSELWPVNDGIFQTLDRAKDHLAGLEKNVERAYPQMYWEGAGEYGDALGRNIQKVIAGQVTAKDALDDAAEEWVKITQKLGIDSQKAQYAKFLESTRKVGMKV